MSLFKKIYNMLFGNKQKEIIKQEVAKAVKQAKEEALTNRIRTYNKPIIITKTITVTPCAEAITDKQENFIRDIERVINKHYGYTKVQFRGGTKNEARQWISNNVNEFYRIKGAN